MNRSARSCASGAGKVKWPPHIQSIYKNNTRKLAAAPYSQESQRVLTYYMNNTRKLAAPIHLHG